MKLIASDLVTVSKLTIWSAHESYRISDLESRSCFYPPIMNREELDYIIQEGEKLLILRNEPGVATQETAQETILRLIREAPSITQKEMASRIVRRLAVSSSI